MKLIHELSLTDLIFTATIMLLGEEGTDYACYDSDPEWWRLRLWIRIN
ncbi:hypothetical protein LCGC14_0393050 [marine sediment metagenome]|uniref:Uncharacterized protein n=1 Tax=marine sediment metagenome TaxID=412755 RepID=A0A0F9T4W6_9ZZZZ